jgi:hypothetical protein
MTKAEWRCTRPNSYPPRSPGHKNPSARQGYYVRADNRDEAREWMRAHFPNDTHFDIELWDLHSLEELSP